MSRIGDPDLPVVPPSESERLDRLLRQANQQRLHAARPSVDREQQDRTAPLPAVPPAASRGEQPADGLRSITWADESPVVPASEPLVASRVARTSSEPQPQLTAQNIGRSAWTEELASAAPGDPDGWDQLSWSDMDNSSPADASGGRKGSGGGASGWGSGPTRMIREWGPVLIAAVVIALFTRLVLVQAYHIPSLSMAPTLDKGDRVIVNRLSYNFGEVERGQVIVFEKPPNQQSDANDLIKRVIGLPGETMQFRDGEVYVDGLLVEEPYLAVQSSTRPRSFSIPGCAQPDPSPVECVVPDGYVFVMGDNRNGSQDSRSFGPIAQDTIVGRAFIVVWPFSDINRL